MGYEGRLKKGGIDEVIVYLCLYISKGHGLRISNLSLKSSQSELDTMLASGRGTLCLGSKQTPHPGWLCYNTRHRSFFKAPKSQMNTAGLFVGRLLVADDQVGIVGLLALEEWPAVVDLIQVGQRGEGFLEGCQELLSCLTLNGENNSFQSKIVE